jgi:RNA polymerase sigma-70 factor (ECF subfamily)
VNVSWLPRLRVLTPRGASSIEAVPTFDRVYDDHVEFVWRSARRLGVEEPYVDDVVQQVFLVVHRRLAEFEARSSLKTWLFSILLRTVRDHRRSTRRKSPHLASAALAPVDADTLPSDRADPEQALARAEASRVIDELLDALEGDKRDVFVMAELEQMTANEIAEATGLDTKAVYSRLRAARTDFERAAVSFRKRAMRENRT